MKRLNMNLPQSLIKDIDIIASEKSYNRTTMIQMILTEYVKNNKIKIHNKDILEKNIDLLYSEYDYQWLNSGDDVEIEKIKIELETLQNLYKVLFKKNYMPKYIERR